MRRSFLLLLAWAHIACGGAPTSSLLGDGGSGTDTGTSDTGTGDTSTTCNISACATIPSGFTVVSLASGMSACPSGWTSTDVVSAPAAGAGACTCSCNVTTPPDCSSGTIDRFLDDGTTATCTEPASTLVATGSACTDSGFFIQFNHGHYAVDPPPPTGGTCAYNAQTDSTMVTSTPGLVCAPPTSCPGAICGTGNVCVSQGGDVMCPAGFPQKTLVGTSATAMCSACGASCAVTGTCTGTLAFYAYGDTTCTTTPLDFTADGSCDANPATNEQTYYEYFEYTGTVASSSCMGQPPTSTATPTLNGPTTVCCQH